MRYLIIFLILANLAFFTLYKGSLEPAVSTSQLPRQPSEIQQLQLLKERGEVNIPVENSRDDEIITKDEPAEVVEAAPADEQPAVEKICYSIGPFTRRTRARQADKLLKTEKYEPRMRDGNIKESSGYWVYLPAKSQQQARTIIADLDLQGMKDYYIGEESVISLGLFSDHAKAVERRDTVTKIGYPAKLDQRYRMRRVYWLDVEEAGVPLLVSAVWQQIIKKSPKVAAQQVSCE